MSKCRQISSLVSKGLDKKLSLSERFAVRMHLMICLGCRNFKKQTLFIRKASSNYIDYLQNNPHKKP